MMREGRAVIMSAAMGLKVCKFGGTSVADADQLRKVQQIVKSDPDRRFIVPSAPGKRTPDDRKITDLLYLCHAHATQQLPFDDVFGVIEARYEQIAGDLDLKVELAGALAKIKSAITAGASADYAASRGEYLNGLIVAALLDAPMIDPADVIRFDDHGRFDAEQTQALMSARLTGDAPAVVPGFFGATRDGQIKTFSRGGSDITGAIVARAASADVYENWTDVSGLLAADPRIVDDPQTIEMLSYRELRELAYMGASVMHDEAIFPVRQAGIPVNIRNTNRPGDAGTLIVPETEPIAHTGSITGIAGRKDFTIIALEKALMNAEIGFGRRLLSVLQDHEVSFEHMPSGIDTMSVVIADSELDGKLERVTQEIHQKCRPDGLTTYADMALIATVGRGMASTPGMAARLFGALGAANINIRMIDQGSSEINIIVGVRTGDFEAAVRAIYEDFLGSTGSGA